MAHNDWDHAGDDDFRSTLQKSDMYRLTRTPVDPLRLFWSTDGTARELGILHCLGLGRGHMKRTLNIPDQTCSPKLSCQSTEAISDTWATGGIAGRSTAEVRAFSMSMPQRESNMQIVAKWIFDFFSWESHWTKGGIIHCMSDLGTCNYQLSVSFTCFQVEKDVFLFWGDVHSDV